MQIKKRQTKERKIANKKYNIAKTMLEIGGIKRFGQLVSQLPYTTLAKDTAIGAQRMKKLYKNVGEMKLGELDKISKVLDVDLELLRSIVYKEIERISRKKNK